MKKILSQVLFLSVFSNLVFAQQGEWTWMKGSSSGGSAGIFGTLQVAAANNTPPAMYGPVTWVDSTGNLWLFAGGNSDYNAVWKYDIITNEWTWMKGDSVPSQPGVYGTMGIPAPGNTPGGRAWGFLSWQDLNGDFWVYGGRGYADSLVGILADLWKYSIVTNEWTWMNGVDTPSVSPIYGVLQVPAPENTPGSRWETTANWVDSEGNLWLFGGWDYNSQPKNDIWKYSISINQWSWMGGSPTNSPANYGTFGIPSATNTPGGRNPYCVFKDRYGNFWLFGGIASGYLNDLWKLDPISVEWSWMGGTNQLNSAGNSGTQCAADSEFYPGSRGENRACWTDSCGNFWLFGGSSNGNLNDLWVYRPDSNDWTFSSGSLLLNQSGVYGTQGVSDPANKPGGRYGATGWMDHSSNIWLFGGKQSNTELNDLWRFVPDPLCPISACLPSSNLPITSFGASDIKVCEKFCISFFDSSTNNPTAWQWMFPNGSPSSSTAQNPSSICYSTSGTYNVTLITTNANGSDTLTLTNYITVNPTPSSPTITVVGLTLTSSPAISYQWQLNSIDIPGATNQSYTILQSGNYTVIIGDSNGCINSASMEVIISGIDEVYNDAGVFLYPNPSNGIFNFEFWSNEDHALIEIFNAVGQLILSEEAKDVRQGVKNEIDLSSQPSGVYMITINTNDRIFLQKILIMK